MVGDESSSAPPAESRLASASLSDQESGSEYSFSSSSAAAGSSALPIEILAQILNHVSFPDLYGSTQFVDRIWHFATTQLILGNAIFLRKLVTTNYGTLIRTNSLIENESRHVTSSLKDDTWPGVALDTSRATEFPGISSTRWRGSSDGKWLFLDVQDFYNQPNLPYILRGRLLTYREQSALTDEEYDTIQKISLEQDRPVLLDVCDFDNSEGDILIDLSECYRLLYADYETLSAERKSLVAMLEADLWTAWAQKHGKYWGKKVWSVYKEGVFIDTLDQFQESLKNSYHGLEHVFDKWDLVRRKMEVYEQVSLQYLADHPRVAFEKSYKQLPASWAGPNPELTITRLDETMNRVVLTHRARYDKTIDLMVREFAWTRTGGIASGILSDDDYEQMYVDWKKQMMVVWSSKTVYESRLTPNLSQSLVHGTDEDYHV
ncbi:protein of unknown function [Taphrina deformans PYCC 5710]|uniref:F-box domain-containing protein n=1 Tax=Taphrina deformans (strain PYCC 5710 / ATCC 11124 / CBS 356.35 / IMI 108563 / JCM 9778 / NBRC 8474) TaxID=1097556 RepID=R4XDA9_TAPDE|nr:protein of unknown function [Taphrina deformans PYCC 5710]|eukprot:CCG83866.1 protein of unknown function [Taphrina deformans PYCC 5710]